MKPRFMWPAIGVVTLVALGVQVRALGRGSARVHGATAAAVASAPATAPVVAAEGRLEAYPGAEVDVGTDKLGVIERLLVHEKSNVRRGEVIAELRADDLRASLAEARARVGKAQADLDLARVEEGRARSLLADRVGTPQAMDRARRDLEAARAGLESASASVRELEAVLAKTRIVAPIDGVVLERYVDAGETVREGDRLVRIADLSRVRIEAEVDEYDSARIVLGAPVAITAEGFEGRAWEGHVEEIPDAVVERGITPRDPARPTDTRVLRVKIALDGETPLKFGQRVEVRIGAQQPAAAAAGGVASLR